MRILMLTDSMNMGGAETHISTLITSLRRRGHSVFLLSGGGLEAESLSCPRLSFHFSRSPLSLLTARFLISSLIKRYSFDLIHSHSRITSFIAAPIARSFSLPLVCTAHARFNARGFYRRLSQWGEHTIAVSRDIEQYLCQSYSLCPENISVIHNGIDLSRFKPSSPSPSQPLTLGFLSRLDSDCSKGARLLCEIAPRLASVFYRPHILIGGGGSAYGELFTLASRVNRSLGYECITLVGRVKNTPEFFKKCNAFVGVSRAAMEAALSGLPVVLCGDEGFFGRLTSQNFHSALSSNFCGRGCEKMSGDALFSHILASVGNDDPRLRSLLVSHFDARVMAEQTEKVYLRVLPQSTKKSGEVLLCGYYGFSNIGDDILLRSAVSRARSQLPDLTISALTKGGKRDRRHFGIRCIKRSSPISVLGELITCKHFILGGGTLLQERTSLRSLLYYCTLLRLAHCFGADCRIWGNGIGELTSSIGRAQVKRVLDACSYVGLRDAHSLTVARALSINPNIRLEADLAEGTEPCSEERSEYLLHRVFGSALPPFIIAAPRRGEGLCQLKKALYQARAKGFCILFIAMHKRQDRALCRRMVKEYGGRMIEGICYSDLLGIAAYSRGVYSMRLHALIAAKSAGVPHKPFGSDRKLRYTKE